MGLPRVPGPQGPTPEGPCARPSAARFSQTALPPPSPLHSAPGRLEPLTGQPVAVNKEQVTQHPPPGGPAVSVRAEGGVVKGQCSSERGCCGEDMTHLFLFCLISKGPVTSCFQSLPGFTGGRGFQNAGREEAGRLCPLGSWELGARRGLALCPAPCPPRGLLSGLSWDEL